MKIQVFDFVDVEAKAEVLGYNVPSGLTVLPFTFEKARSKDDLCYLSPVLDLKSHFLKAGIEGTALEEEGEPVHTRISESVHREWFLSTVFIGEALISANPYVIDVVLDLVSSYLYDWLKKTPSATKADLERVTLDVVVGKKDKTYKKVRYEGPAAKITEVAEAIHKILSDD